MSRLRPLTLLISQVQLTAPSPPSRRANPVMLWTALLLCVTVVPDAPAAGCCPAPRARPSYTGPPPWQQGRSRRTQRVKSPQSIVITGGSSGRSEEHTSELQSLMRISYAVFCLTQKNTSPSHQL